MAWDAYDAGTALLTIDYELANLFAERVAADLAGIDASVQLNPDTRRFDELVGELNRSVDIAVNLNAAQVATVQGQLDYLTRDRVVDIAVDLDAAQVAVVQGQLDYLTRNRTVDVVVDLGSAVSAELAALGDRKLTLTPEVDMTAAADAERLLQYLARRRRVLYSPEVDMTAAADAERLLLYLSRRRRVTFHPGLDPTEAARAELLLEQLARDRRVNIDVNANGLSGAGRNAEAARRSLSAMSLVKFGGLVSGIGAVAAAVGGLVGLAGGAGAALAAIGGVAAVGASGLGAAFQARKAATASAASDASAVADATKSRLDAVESANRRVETSQKALNQAYRDAGRELRDMNAQLRDAELSQEGAAIAVARAKENLDRVQADPKSSYLDIREADLRRREAETAYERAKTKTSDLRIDNAEAQAKGITGSDTVQNAKQDLAESEKALADAEEALSKAGSSASSSQTALNDALAKLTPNARDFYEQVVGLGPAWTELRRAVSDNMFDGLGASFTDLATTQMPNLQKGMEGIATGLNGALKDTFSSLDSLLTQLTNNGVWGKFVEGANSALSAMAPMTSALVNGFAQFGATVGPTLGPLFTNLAGVINTVTPALAQMGAVFSTSLAGVMPVLGEFINALAENLTPLIPVLASIFSEIGKALTPILPQISELAQVFGTALAGAIHALAPALGPLMDVFVLLFKAVAPFLPVLAELVSSVVEAVAPAFIVLLDALAPVLAMLAQELSPIIESIAPVLGQLAGIFAEAFAGALRQVAPLLPPLVQSFAGLLEALLPLLPPILELALSAAPAMVKILTTAIPVFTQMIDVITSLVNMLTPVLIPAINAVGDVIRTVFGEAAGVISGFWADNVSPVLTKLREGFDSLKPVMEGVGAAVSVVWDGIVRTIKSAVGRIGGLLAGIDVGNVLIKAMPGATAMHNLGVELKAWAEAKADGGILTGPGGPTSDNLLIAASPGEYVIKAAAVSRYGQPLFDMLNGEQLPRYATGGPVNALEFARAHPNVPYEWGGESISGADCSGWVGMLQQVATGVGNPTARLGTTESVMGGTWPQVLAGASPSDEFAIGSNWTHMAATILGVNVESAASPGTVRVGPGAAGAFDKQFTKRVHVDPAVFRPPYQAQDAAVPEQTQQNELDDRTDRLANSVEPATSSPAATANSGAGSTMPGTWTDLASRAFSGQLTGPGQQAGQANSFQSALGAFAGGMLGDALKVFGVPDTMPTVVTALGGYLYSNPGLLAGTYKPPAADAAAEASRPQDKALLNQILQALGIKQRPAQAFADGGLASGPGGPRHDMIDARLSPGEFVVNAASTEANLPLLHAINNDAAFLSQVTARQPAYGSVAAAAATATRGNVDQSATYNVSTPDIDTAFQRAKTIEAQRALTFIGRWS